MSSSYVLEPPTKGKVVLNTSYGPLDIELWPKEAPKATRNFVQLCLEGYYDNTIFHRIIKEFLVQGGDPTGTGEGGESIYGSTFPDEYHTRLRFKHRGLVACANAGTPNSNGSQFFMTLDRCDWLDKKHTIFGKVTGESIFNLLTVGEVETDKSDRPIDTPPKILSVEVLWNPFDDIIPREAPKKISPVHTESKDQKKKAVKKLNLLSFQEEAEEEEKEVATIKEKFKSSHDVLNDPRLLKEEADLIKPSLSEIKKTRDTVRDALSLKKEESRRQEFDISKREHSDDDEASFDVRMRQQILTKRKEHGDLPTRQNRDKVGSSSKDHRKSPPRSDKSDTEDKPKIEKLSLKRKGLGSEARAERLAKADVDLQLLPHFEQIEHLRKQKKRRNQGREDEVMAKLEKFKNSKLTKPIADVKSEEASNEDLSGWAATPLTFGLDSSKKDDMARKNDPNDYVVYDPLLEEGKQKFNKMEAKRKKKNREWAGKSID